MRILFLDCTKTAYNGETYLTKPMGGIEAVTTLLSQALSGLGHDVHVVNAMPKDLEGTYGGVHWFGYDRYQFDHPDNCPDIVIANNDARLFDKAALSLNAGALPVLWNHNRVLLEKTIRKGRLLPLAKWRPVGVFLGEKHKTSCHFLHMFRTRCVLPHGLPKDFLNAQERKSPNTKTAIFFSQPYRGLKHAIAVWERYVHPQCPDAILTAFTNNDPESFGVHKTREDLSKSNIMLMDKVPRKELVDHLNTSRVMIYPGHKDETFCNAAAEASALGVPIVTNGIGSLSERVVHGLNGFNIPQSDEKGMGEAIVQLLKDDDLWQKQSAAAINMVKHMSWDAIAKKWEQDVFNLKK